MHLQETKEILRRSSLFRDLNDIHLGLVMMVCEESNHLAGEYIFHQDDPGDALYIVAHGEVDIVLEPKRPGDPPLYITTLKEEDTFGEVILVEEGTRTASVVCRTDVQLLRIPRERLLKLCSDYPAIGFRIMSRLAAELANKLHSSNMDIREHLFGELPEN